MFKSLLTAAGLIAAATAFTPPANPPSSQSFPAPDLAAIKAVDPSTFMTYKTGNLEREDIISNATIAKRWICSTSAQFTWGDADNTLGIRITNGDPNGWRGFYVYHNSCDRVPYKYIWIEAGKTAFVSLPALFEGRIIRGEDYLLNGQPQTLATWFEFSFDKDNIAWGDVSLIRGTDGAVLMWSEDGSGSWKGWDWWILDGAPSNAYRQKSNGIWVIRETENGDGSINTSARDYLINKVGTERVYVDDYHGNPVISSRNGRFGTHWGPGRP
ncbi:hypothetical protein B0H66DRAFT_483227 [Apodospora peruviana]|uniref:Uncharacterized protein n=1 Tax=Apodospora peruviana TaxID=516989 RepID=A0AAE0HWE7_9PEZI|nr:hypothetical protein B0H66DRAFT_483227 [Apodospora peruviana]